MDRQLMKVALLIGAGALAVIGCGGPLPGSGGFVERGSASSAAGGDVGATASGGSSGEEGASTSSGSSGEEATSESTGSSGQVDSTASTGTSGGGSSGASSASSSSGGTGGTLAADGDVLDEGTEQIPGLRIFNPKNYPGYDPTGATESSDAFNAAVSAAHDYAAAHPNASDLFQPPTHVNAPSQPQAVVRVDPGVFMLYNVRMQSNVRLEINAGALIIPPDQDNTLVFNGSDDSSLGGNSGTTYIHDFTVTAWGRSSTFPDTGGRVRNKHMRYAFTFPDGTVPDLDSRFVFDFNPTRYPIAAPNPGDGPRFSGVKLRQAKRFLVSKFLELASVGNPGYAPDGGGQGSNTYPSTPGNGFSAQPATGQPMTEAAVQPRNGTIRHLHCENCTRGYGIMEIHAGVDLDYKYISTRGGIAVRWESAQGGQSTRQTASQIVAFDGNAAVLFSNHGFPQRDLHADHVVAHGMDDGIRTFGDDGMAQGNRVDGVDVYDGDRAQVLITRNGGDDFWWYGPAEYAFYLSADGTTVTNARCRGNFTHASIGASCTGVAP